MAIIHYIADSAILPTTSLVPKVRSNSTSVRCMPTSDPAAIATATTFRITHSFIG